MDLTISYNWIREYLWRSIGIEELAEKLSLHGPTVERILEVSYPLKGVVVGRIESIDDHPNADRLSLCQVSLGNLGKIKIVCGAPNIRVGQLVPVGLPGRARIRGAILEKAKIRDVVSHGMLLSPYELELSDDHSGIWILPNDLKVGESIKEFFPANDCLLKIEVTPNRPDAMSVVGIAREASAITGIKFHDPFLKKNKPLRTGELKVEVKSKLCGYYELSLLSDIDACPSPIPRQIRLYQSGLRPINKVVDASNYVMLEYGHPSHAFSYSSLDGGKITVRKAEQGENFLGLDKREYTLDKEDLVIAGKNKVLGLAGILGGEDSGVGEDDAAEVALETAIFDPKSIRRTMRRHDIDSKAGCLFEKGLAPEIAPFTALRVSELLGAQIISHAVVRGDFSRNTKLKVSGKLVNQKIGLDISLQEQSKSLKSLGFKVKLGLKNLDIEVPWWRRGDVTAEIDIVEEVARIHGFHRLKGELPPGNPSIQASDKFFEKESLIKLRFSELGFKEIRTFPFLSDKHVEMFSLYPKDLVNILNPLTQEMKYLRPNLISTALLVVAENSDHIQDFRIFESAPVYISAGEAKLPHERYEIVALEAGSDLESVFRRIKGAAEAVLGIFDLKELRFTDKAGKVDITFESGKIGEIGVVPFNQSPLGIKSKVAYLWLNLEEIWRFACFKIEFREKPVFPPLKRDISFVLTKGIRYNEIAKVFEGFEGVDSLLSRWELFDRFDMGENKVSWAFHLYFSSEEKTLKEEEVKNLEDRIVKNIETKLGAYVRSKAR